MEEEYKDRRPGDNIRCPKCSHICDDYNMLDAGYTDIEFANLIYEVFQEHFKCPTCSCIFHTIYILEYRYAGNGIDVEGENVCN